MNWEDIYICSRLLVLVCSLEKSVGQVCFFKCCSFIVCAPLYIHLSDNKDVKSIVVD